MPAKNVASTRYSELSEITPQNVGNLRVTFTFSVGVNRGQESSPLVIGGTMYVLSPYPNILYALDLTKPGAPLKWQYNPKPEAAAQGVACCDVVNRGPTFADGHVFFNTLDGNVVSVDAETGREAWKTKVGNIHIGETMTMAPLVARGKVFVGNSGGEFGVRGWIQALDQQSGKVAWKAFNTGPDKDVLIGPAFKPFYDMDKGQDLGGDVVAAPGLGAGRRHGLGVALLRPRSRSPLSRHGQSRSLERRPAARRQQVDVRHLCARGGNGSGALVLPVEPARSL